MKNKTNPIFFVIKLIPVLFIAVGLAFLVVIAESHTKISDWYEIMKRKHLRK